MFYYKSVNSKAVKKRDPKQTLNEGTENRRIIKKNYVENMLRIALI